MESRVYGGWGFDELGDHRDLGIGGGRVLGVNSGSILGTSITGDSSLSEGGISGFGKRNISVEGNIYIHVFERICRLGGGGANRCGNSRGVYPRGGIRSTGVCIGNHWRQPCNGRG